MFPARFRRRRSSVPGAGLALLALFFMSASEAVACQVCADQGIQFGMPYGIPVGVVLAGWIATAFCFRRRLKLLEREDVSEPGAPGWNAVVYFTWTLGAGVLIGLFTLTPHICLWLIASIWIVYLAVKVAQSARRSTRPPATRLFFRLNAAALAVSVIVIPASYAWARLPKNVVAFIGNPVTANGILPHVIAAGEPAIPYLKEALEKSVADVRYVPTYTVTQACYCLARIGGPAAEEALRGFVKALGDRTETEDSRWPLVACCSYAECAGARAVPDLKRLYDAATGGDDAALRVAALCGLARTADRDGLAFVRAHLNELRAAAETTSVHRGVGEVAKRIADYVENERAVDSLRTAPIYDTSGLSFGIPDDVATRPN
ncbi:MAG: hypothetical protein ACT4QC_08470 [Planctomycetaceae bacterium]